MPELRVRQVAHRLGYRFRLHRKDLPGKPDLVFPGRRMALFVNGCFWHRHAGCTLARLPKSRLEFWEPKLEGNRQRDFEVHEKLRVLGWNPAVIWECETQSPTNLEASIRAILGGRNCAA